VADPARSPEWNRGAYLVRGLGHCAACHSARNAFGATSRGPDLGGGLIPMQNWYAPSLNSPHEAGLADWSPQDVVALLKTGMTPRASVSGPMATVVLRSTQFMTDDDLLAMAAYLRALPQKARTGRDPGSESAQGNKVALLAKGATLYGDRCVQCHGDKGEGVPGAYPALAGNRAVAMDSPANVVRIVADGGFSPATATNPRPFGMPPFSTSLSSEEIAAVVSYVRDSWGNGASPVSSVDVDRYKASLRN
jgi:mono/diheme cytochrome c family protein